MGRNTRRTKRNQEFEKLSFEDLLENRLEIGDLVEITAKPRGNQDVETFYYLKEFHGKQGELTRIVRGKVISFEITFKDGTQGYFYENEISKIGGMNNDFISKTKGKNRRTKRKN
ncbi:hypothetical protein [Bacillus andreraoultii]|uniref:hypothetical protein n=1 Tax=Bacillus andreraoultii TaxID=1499685 RepID=UPI000539FEBB|nr:hypothetical protein [Bacillus andreraoultii]